jgi:hypothetical protein
MQLMRRCLFGPSRGAWSRPFGAASPLDALNVLPPMVPPAWGGNRSTRLKGTGAREPSSSWSAGISGRWAASGDRRALPHAVFIAPARDAPLGDGGSGRFAQGAIEREIVPSKSMSN